MAITYTIKGTVEVANVEEEETMDESTPVVRYGAGDYFGDISVLLNKPRAADARAVTALELYVLKKPDFAEVINRFPDLQNYFKAMAESSLTNLKKKVRFSNILNKSTILTFKLGFTSKKGRKPTKSSW
jgi:F-box/leucine-rich repeat protein 7